MDLMWPLWMMFRASGLSTKIQWRTSRIPERSLSEQMYINRPHLRLKSNFSVKCYKGLEFPIIPDEDSSLSSLLTNQSNLRENWVQLFLFPRISAAEQKIKFPQGLMKIQTRFTKDMNQIDPSSWLVHKWMLQNGMTYNEKKFTIFLWTSSIQR